MKTPLALFTAACLLASCSRSGTTIANDDSVFTGNAPVTTERVFTEYPVSDKALPQEVRLAFQSRYQSPQNVQWVLMTRDGNYKADFFIGKIKWQAVFAPDGRLVSEWHQ